MATDRPSKALSDEEASRIAERYGPHVRVFPLEDANRVAGTKQVQFRGCSFNLKYSGKSRGSQQTFECTKRRSLGCTAQVLLFDDLDYALMKYGHNHGISSGSKSTAAQWSEGIVPRPVALIAKAKPSKPTARVRADLEKATPVHGVAWDKPPQHAFPLHQLPTRNVIRERMDIASRLTSIVGPSGDNFVRTLQVLPELVVVCSSSSQLRAVTHLEPDDVLVLDVCTRSSRAHGEMLLNLALWHSQTDSVSLIATVVLGRPGPSSFKVALQELVHLCHLLASAAVQIVVPYLPQLHAAVVEAMPYASLHGRTEDLRAYLAASLGNHQQTQLIVSLMERLSESSCSPEMWTAQVTSLSESVVPALFQQLCTTWLNSDATFPPLVWAMPSPQLIGSEAATRALSARLQDITKSDSVVDTVESLKILASMCVRESAQPNQGRHQRRAVSSPTQLSQPQCALAKPQQHLQAQQAQQRQQAQAQAQPQPQPQPQSQPVVGMVHRLPYQPEAQQLMFSGPAYQGPPQIAPTLAALQPAQCKMAVGSALPNPQRTAPGMHMHASLPMLAHPEALARRTHSLPAPSGQSLQQKMFEGSAVRLAPIHFPGDNTPET